MYIPQSNILKNYRFVAETQILYQLYFSITKILENMSCYINFLYSDKVQKWNLEVTPIGLQALLSIWNYSSYQRVYANSQVFMWDQQSDLIGEKGLNAYSTYHAIQEGCVLRQ